MIDLREAQRRLGLMKNALSLSRRELLTRQRGLLSALLQEIRQVPHYADLLAKVNLKELGPDDLPTLPISTRDILRGQDETRLLHPSASRDQLLEMRSSGSTGRPIVALQTPLERLIYIELRRRTFASLGPEMVGPRTYVGLDSRSPDQKQQPLADGLTVVECRQDIEKVFAEVKSSAPQVLVSYPGVLAELAQRFPHDELRRLDLKLIVASGEVLTPVVERAIKDAFGARITTTYASSEFFFMASRCEVTGEYHIVDDGLVLEVVDESGIPVPPGVEGNVVATALHSFAQPLVRYEIGDRAVQGSAPTLGSKGCLCGAPFSTLKAVLGRSIDYLTLPDSQRVHAYTVSIPLREALSFASQYRLIQESRTEVLVEYIGDRAMSDEEGNRIKSQLSTHLPGVTIQFSRVAMLPRQANGKFRVVESRA